MPRDRAPNPPVPWTLYLGEDFAPVGMLPGPLPLLPPLTRKDSGLGGCFWLQVAAGEVGGRASRPGWAMVEWSWGVQATRGRGWPQEPAGLFTSRGLKPGSRGPEAPLGRPGLGDGPWGHVLG